MKLRIAALLMAAPLACGGGGTEAPTRGNVLLKDANNYTSESTLTIATVQTKSGADLNVCWDGIAKDILCHDIVPGSNGIDNVAFLQIPNMSKDTVATKLAAGQLDPNLVKVYGDYHTSQATTKCVNLSQLSLGKAIDPATDYVESTNKVYMMLFATGTTPGVGARSMVFIEPTAASQNTMVAGPDGCNSTPKILDFQATLGTAIAIPATDATMWKIDWADISHDSFGNPVQFSHLNRVLVGFYQNKTVADLQTGFLDIQETATALYEVPVTVGSKYVDLSAAKLQGGTTPFPGFTQTDGTWMVAVLCDDCQLPAPIVLSVLTPQ